MSHRAWVSFTLALFVGGVLLTAVSAGVLWGWPAAGMIVGTAAAVTGFVAGVN